MVKTTNLLRFLPRVFYSKGDPLQFIFFITSKCNLRCQHCFYLENLNQQPKNELSLKEIEKISQSMGKLLWLSLTGGEPFLREDIVQIAEIFYRNNKFNLSTICTNGVLQDSIILSVSEICKKCKDAHLIVYVSLDGLEETHDQIRGAPGVFKKAVETIIELKKLKKDFKNMNVATITTCNAKNQKEMKSLALFLKDKIKPDSIAINLIRGKPRSSNLGEINLKNYFDFIEIQKEGWTTGDFSYFNLFGKILLKRKELLQKTIISNIFNENSYLIPCRAGNISCIMNEIGDLYPCEILDKKIGNIRDVGYNFKKLWYSDRAEEIRRFIKDTNCYCTYECAITTNILFNISQLIKMFIVTSVPSRNVTLLHP